MGEGPDTNRRAAAPPPGGGDGDVELTIVMPCLNEAETIGSCIRKARRFLDDSGVRGEIVVGDNGSTDGSREIAERLGARVVDVPTRGYGAALTGATLAARGKYVIMGDSDDSYDFAALGPFLDKLRDGCDLVMGNRFAGGILRGAMPWKNRWIGNPILSGVGRLLFRSPVRDFHCGLRGCSREAFERLDLRTTDMEFASEMVAKATLLGMRVAEVPTTLSPAGRSRRPHLRPWRDAWRHVRFMLLYSPRWLFLYPGMLLIGGGLAVGLWVLPAPRTVGGVTFDVHTLFFAAIAVVLGVQAVAFALLSRTFAEVTGLLPTSRRLAQLRRIVTLEVGLIAGVVLAVGGLVGAIYGVTLWGTKGFGPIDPRRVLRVVIPSGLAMCLGVQVVLSGFFASLLRLHVRRPDPPRGREGGQAGGGR